MTEYSELRSLVIESHAVSAPSILSPQKVLRRILVGSGLALIAYFVLTYVPRFFVFTEASYTPYFWSRVSWIFPHVLAGVVAITIGPMQLWAGIRNRYRKFHRVAGRTYVLMVLLGSFAAFALSLTASFSLAYRSGLFFLAVAWLATTGMAFTAIRRRNFTQHRQWMIRSYVVTFAFVTFRVGQDVMAATGIATLDETRATMAWASWAVPLLITEMVFQSRAIFAKPGGANA